jgi:transcriptional regulator with PAS, ATPase and Fis domain
MTAAVKRHDTASCLVIDDPTDAGYSPVIAAVAKDDLSVLVRGESGAGKEVLAQTLHRRSGRRGPMICVNCAAIGAELLESELFGHERGAFTGAVSAKPGLLEVAAGGTVLLDEIGDMPMGLQAKLLRVVESGEVMRVGATRMIPIHVRFVSATHRDVLADVESGRFRLDLYYRLAGITLEILPLRARRHRVVPLANHMLEARGVASRLTASAGARLRAHDWPGNARELRNVLARALVLASGGPIDAHHVVFDVRIPTTVLAGSEPPLLDTGERAERSRIMSAIEACNGNQTRAAKLLGISRSTLATKLAILRIPRPRK